MSTTQRKLLAIDASTERCSVALGVGEGAGGHTFSDSCDTPRSHAQVLLPMVDKLLGEAGLELSELDAIVVGLGPGSFTGIRIGISIAQGLAYGARIPLYGSSSLAILAHGLSAESRTNAAGPHFTIPCLDARMNEIYWAVFDDNGSQVVPPQVSAPQALARYLLDDRPSGTAVIGGGHGWGVEGLSDTTLTLTGLHSQSLPEAVHLLDIWRAKFSRGEIPDLNVVIEPLYLRNEVSWDKRKRIRSHSPLES